MKATVYCKANYLIFLNDKDDVIAYQLDESFIEQQKYFPIKYPSELPEGTKKTLILNDIWSTIAYEKENISDIEAKIVTYKMNELMSQVITLVKKDLDKSSTITHIITNTSSSSTTEADSECPSWVPTAEEHGDKLFQCKFCINETECYREM